MINFLKRTLDHYAASGKNSAIVVRNDPDDFQRSMKRTTIQLRRGREGEGEAVQVEIGIEEFYASGRSASKHASVSFDQATWDAIVAHVSRARELDRAGKEVAS